MGALHYAAVASHVEVVKVLLNAGASVDLVDKVSVMDHR